MCGQHLATPVSPPFLILGIADKMFSNTFSDTPNDSRTIKVFRFSQKCPICVCTFVFLVEFVELQCGSEKSSTAERVVKREGW